MEFVPASSTPTKALRAVHAKMKNMYGKKVRIERSTFLVGADGKPIREWRKVKADGHAAEVLAAVKSRNAILTTTAASGGPMGPQSLCSRRAGA
jgi:peroxiredoxin